MLRISVLAILAVIFCSTVSSTVSQPYNTMTINIPNPLPPTNPVIVTAQVPTGTGALPAWPWTIPPFDWLPSVHYYEYAPSAGLSPNVALQLREGVQPLRLLGTSQWGVASRDQMYSAFSTGYSTIKKSDVVLNAADAKDLIITNLSTSLEGDLTSGAIRFGTTMNGLTAAPQDAERMTILNNGNIGINNSIPIAKLQITHGSVLFDGIVGVTPIEGPGTRFMWIPEKAALRAGRAVSTEWDALNIGSSSIGLGENVLASKPHSISIGFYNEATEDYTTAVGQYSFARGQGSLAIGLGSVADNIGTVAIGGGESHGTHSQSIGINTIAYGDRAMAIGYNTIAEAYGSTVVGYSNLTNANYNRTTWVNTDPIFIIGNGNETQGNSNALTVLKNGNVGIGIVNPRAKLVVNGLACATEFRVSLNAEPCWWPDYVFAENYELMPLDSLESYIKLNKHLPEIPAADDIVNNGIELGSMQAKLLKRIEELTLYIIELNKQNQDLRKRVDNLEHTELCD